MKVYSAEETASRLPFAELIDQLETFFIEGCEAPLRHIHTIENPSPHDPNGHAAKHENGTLLLMPAWQSGKKLGVKTVTVFPTNAAFTIPSSPRRLPAVHSVYMLYEATTGVPLAHMDGGVLTSRRTAAASVLAARYLARKDSKTLLIVGTGNVARLLPLAYRTEFPNIRKVFIWGRSASSAVDLSQELQQQSQGASDNNDEDAVEYEAVPIDNLEAAVRSADIISCATLATEPLIQGKWLAEGSHLDLIGGFTPEMRECDSEALQRGRVFIDTEEALLKAGDLLTPIANGEWKACLVCATLSDLCRQREQQASKPPVVGRRSAKEITVFKSVGNALEDLAAGCLVHDDEDKKDPNNTRKIASFPL